MAKVETVVKFADADIRTLIQDKAKELAGAKAGSSTITFKQLDNKEITAEVTFLQAAR